MPDLPEPVPHRGWDPRVLAFRSGSIVTVFAVLTRRWTVLVDTLYSEAGARELAEQALQAARRVHGTAPPLLVVNTHADWDHAWGNAVFAGPQAAFPAPVLGTRECARRLRSAEEAAELETSLAREPERYAGAARVPPTLAFEGSAEIDGDDLTLQLLPAPGHKPDQVVVWIPEIGHLLAADAAEYPMPFVEGPGHLARLVATLEALRDLHPRKVLACHAPLDGDPALLERNLAYFARVREAAASGPAGTVPPEDLEETLGLPFREVARDLPEEAWDFYREAHRKALAAAWFERAPS